MRRTVDFYLLYKDTGGDGLCCTDGSGSYKVSWDGESLKEGAAFYESETTPFGGCGESEQPTASPSEAAEDDTSSGVTISSGADGESGDLAYRCVAKALLEQGYEVSSDKCDMFVDCFNQQINVADDWFCDEVDQCVSVSACSMKKDETSDEDSATELPLSSPPLPASRPAVTQPTSTEMSSVAPMGTTDVSLLPTTSPARGTSVETLFPTPAPGTSNETLLPTTLLPTLGPCGGLPCLEAGHCRSQYGFCGPSETYCDESAIWTKDCPDPEPSSHPSPPPQKESPTTIPSTNTAVTFTPTVSAPGLDNLPFSKPEGGKKPVGGKGEPTVTNPHITYDSTMQAIDTSVISSRPTALDTTVTPTNNLSTRNPTSDSPSSPPLATIDTDGPSSPISSIDASSDDFWANTYSITTPSISPVTTSPSISLENNVKDESLLADSAVEAVEDGCTGEPCPVTTHCRSRYGSCGPGFIYWYVSTVNNAKMACTMVLFNIAHQ